MVEALTDYLRFAAICPHQEEFSLDAPVRMVCDNLLE
jgi:hypothetical protein